MPDPNEILTEAQQILDAERSRDIKFTGNGFQYVDRQIRAIIRVAKYKLRWKRSSIFSYILESCPELRERLNVHEIKHSKTSALFQLMDSSQKSLVIKRLDQIQKHNKEKNQNA
jgi:hypothetical protein